MTLELVLDLSCILINEKNEIDVPKIRKWIGVNEIRNNTIYNTLINYYSKMVYIEHFNVVSIIPLPCSPYNPLWIDTLYENRSTLLI